jgi:hypothetical protein
MSRSSAAPPALDHLAAAVARLGHSAMTDSRAALLRLRLPLDHGAAEVLLIPDRDDGDLLCLLPDWLVLPNPLPDPGARGRLAELLLAANFELALAAFELDPHGGEVRLRLTLPLAGARVTDDQLARSLAALRHAAERYWPAAQKVLWAGSEPAAALEDLSIS